MKLSSKPISSPCRPDKYPPQLMRFLRSRSASRSRGRSRSSPMFVKRKNAAIETQEPSSPKVTCMGQVRVKLPKQTALKSAPPGAPTRRNGRGKWIAGALFCNNFAGKVKVKPLVTPQEKWGRFFFGSCRKPNAREDSSKIHGNEEEAKVFASSSCSSPPKNALILTRSRSAPYRSSSLAYRFWESPLATHGTNEETELENRVSKEEGEEEKSDSREESICENSNHGTHMDSGTEENPDFCNELEESKTEEMGNVRPPILTRCKSEPARRAARLHPEMSFWKKRTLGFT
ncbi:hypothetical protein like AT5G03110 [Hibiscus trionum]|uniref:Protamine P1 family protein n=1 Tax=Hibiscus trionum TaxID=183268 RepID=A0A9W7H8G3_HIBTR|nr:hypothetical protein like AT5G03110 [Hibiscus trionum]